MFLANITNGSFSNPNSTLINVARSQSGLCLNIDTDGTRAAKTIAYIVVIFVSFFGNSLIAAVIFKDKRMQTPVNFFIFNMAISDLLITVFFMPRMLSRIFYGIDWQITGTAGLILCKISPSMQELCSSLSVLLFMAIAVDRFLAVILPLKKIITKNVSLVIIGVIWTVALSIRAPVFYGFQLVKVGSKVYCASMLEDPVADGIYRHFSFVIFYVVPLCIVVFLYTAVIVALKNHKRPGAASLTQQNVQLRRTHRILKMLVTVVLSFAVCWFLYFCLPALIKYLPYQNVVCYLFFPMFFFCHVNCALNPVVYLIFIGNFRREVRNILLCVFPCQCFENTVNPYEENSTSELKMVTRGRSSTVDLGKKI